jgi:ABC-type phosphate transport system ATPase subunit
VREELHPLPNRMNDLSGAQVSGQILYHGRDTLHPWSAVSAAADRHGLQTERFRSRSTTTSAAARACSAKKDIQDRVERTLVQAALWDR